MKNRKLFLVLRRAAAVVSLLSLIPLIFEVIFLDIVPMRYLLMLFPLYIILVLAASIITFTGKPAKRHLVTASCVVTVLAIIINIVGYQAIQSATSLLYSIQRQNVSYVDYSIIAKKGSGVSLESATSCGLISTDSLRGSATEGLKNETSAQTRDYENVMAVLNGLVNNQEVELAALRTSTLSLLKTENLELYDQIEVIGSFSVKDTSSNNELITTDTSKPFAVYISGIDTYGEISTQSRSDVNILAVINPETRKIVLVNTPRDYYVQLHGTTGLRDKLTHAGTYGVDSSRQTIEDLYGVSVPYHVRINFTSLVKLIDVIGPIQVNSDYAFKSYEVGPNTLNSAQALEFSRERYSFEDGDRQRGQNQQKVIEAIIAKMSRPENAVKLPEIFGALENSVETNMSEASLKTLIRGQLDDVRRWQVRSLSVDGSGAMLPTYTYGSSPLYVMVPDQTTVDYAKRIITETLE